MSAAINIQGLCKTYNLKKTAPVKAVDNLKLSVPTGQILGFLGPNGAGKTTTIKMMCGLVIPDSGTISLNGYDVASQRSNAMRQIGAVLEGTRNIYWRLTAWQNLIYFGRLKGRRGLLLKNRAAQMLHELDLWDRRDDPVRQFSRGMQQKVAIACALITDPPIVLLDEPTLGLDVQASRTVKEWVRRLAAEQGKTIVLTTHQLDMAQELCDRVAIIRKGQLVADYSVDELLGLFRQEYYEIRVQGQLDGWNDGIITRQENEQTIVTTSITQQSELYDLIDHVRISGLTLVSVRSVEPDLEEVFVELIEREV